MLYGKALRDYVTADFVIKCIHVYTIMNLESDEPTDLFDPFSQNLLTIDKFQEEIKKDLSQMED